MPGRMTAHGPFILQCSNYLLLVGLPSLWVQDALAKELPVSLAKNVEFLRNLRNLPKLNAINGSGDYGLGLRPGLASPLVETADFGPNPGALRMFSFVPGSLQEPPALVVVLHGCGQTAAGY